MSDGYNLAQTGNLSPEDFAQQQALNRQQKMAAMLMQQSGQPQGQMISGRYVAPSWAQQLVPLANIMASKYIGEKADTQAAQLAQQIRENQATANQRVLDKFLGTPAVPAVEGGIQGPSGQMTKETTADMFNADMSLNPEYKKVAPVAGKAATGPDLAAALREIDSPTNYYGAGKDLKATIISRLSPEDTADYRNYLKVKAEYDAKGIPLGFDQYQTMDANRKRPVTNLSVNMPSESERKAGTMVTILDSNLSQMQKALGVDPTAVKPNVPASVVEAITGPNLLSRSIKPAQRQIIEDSQLDVLDAALTLRTGAAYTREQLLGMRDTYFPKLGDKPQTVQAKQQRLESLLQGAYISAGRATPPRTSTPYVAPVAPAQPNVNQQLNIPAVTAAPKFLGFEDANR